MNTIRERFEEIWPVPEGVYWCEVIGAYEYDPKYGISHECQSLNLRLDTFTRCQETTAIYSGLVDDLITELEFVRRISVQPDVIEIASKSISRAKQIMEQKK